MALFIKLYILIKKLKNMLEKKNLLYRPHFHKNYIAIFIIRGNRSTVGIASLALRETGLSSRNEHE